MNLREWNSNSNEFSELLPVDKRSLVSTGKLKVLGLFWSKIKDVLLISGADEVSFSNVVTRRDVLYTVVKIFDPLRLITPVTYYSRVFLQKLLKLVRSWDDPLPHELVNDWHKILKVLHPFLVWSQPVITVL